MIQLLSLDWNTDKYLQFTTASGSEFQTFTDLAAEINICALEIANLMRTKQNHYVWKISATINV